MYNGDKMGCFRIEVCFAPVSKHPSEWEGSTSNSKVRPITPSWSPRNPPPPSYVLPGSWETSSSLVTAMCQCNLAPYFIEPSRWTTARAPSTAWEEMWIASSTSLPARHWARRIQWSASRLWRTMPRWRDGSLSPAMPQPLNPLPRSWVRERRAWLEIGSQHQAGPGFPAVHGHRCPSVMIGRSAP